MGQWLGGDEITAIKLNSNRGFNVGFHAKLANPVYISSPTAETIIFDNEFFDKGGVYNVATGYFTATPYSGYYFIDLRIGLDNNADGSMTVKVIKTGGINLVNETCVLELATAPRREQYSFAAYLTAGQTLHVTVGHNMAADQAPVLYSYFDAFLISTE